MKVTNYDIAREQIRQFLGDYLTSQGIQKLSSFSCINPSHSDKRASCGLLADGTHFNCLGCGTHGDIFDAAHFLEDLPNSGPLFIQDNLLVLAKRYGISIETAPLSAEQIHEMDCFRAYQQAAQYLSTTFIVSQGSKGKLGDHLTIRDWAGTDKQWNHIGIGYCEKAQELVGHLLSCGFTREFIHEIELDNTDLFTDRLLFIISDSKGRPVGFSGRSLSSDDKRPRYLNTSSLVPIFKKGQHFYNLHNALSSIQKDPSLPLYIVEGHPDVVAASLAGMDNICAIGGSKLTEDHVLLLREEGISNIVLCLDGDKAGQEATEKILDERFSGHQDLSVRVVIIPQEMDPDEYIREFGITKFRQLAPRSAFEWRLLRFPEDADSEEICRLMIPLIVGEPSFISQEKMCIVLSKHTGISQKAITAELTRLLSERERKIARDRDFILDKLNRSLEVSPSDAEVVIHEALQDLQSLNEKYNQDKLSPESCIKLLDDQKVAEENKSDKFEGFRLGSDLVQLEMALEGEWKRDVLLVFGGKANSGKTSLLAKLAHSIASIPENNAICIFHTIDDTAAQFLPKLICIAEGSRSLSINEVRNPNYYAALGSSDTPKKRSEGYNVIKEMMKNFCLVLKDSNDGNTLSYADSLIRYYRERFPDRRIVYFLDNMHKLQEFGDVAGDERIKFRKISERCKNLATRHHITIVSTVEYTKLAQGVKPTNYNIAETVQIEYDSNFIAHLYNEAHEYGEEEAAKKGMTHNVLLNGVVKRMPIIELTIGKNKVNDFKNRIYFNFYPASSDFVSRKTEEVEQIVAEKKKENQPPQSDRSQKTKLFGAQYS